MATAGKRNAVTSDKWAVRPVADKVREGWEEEGEDCQGTGSFPVESG